MRPLTIQSNPFFSSYGQSQKASLSRPMAPASNSPQPSALSQSPTSGRATTENVAGFMGVQTPPPDMSAYNPGRYASQPQPSRMFSQGQAQPRQQSLGTPYGGGRVYAGGSRFFDESAPYSRPPAKPAPQIYPDLDRYPDLRTAPPVRKMPVPDTALRPPAKPAPQIYPDLDRYPDLRTAPPVRKMPVPDAALRPPAKPTARQPPPDLERFPTVRSRPATRQRTPEPERLPTVRKQPAPPQRPPEVAPPGPSQVPDSPSGATPYQIATGDPRGLYAMAPIDQRPAPFTIDSMYGPMGETSSPFADRDSILERIMSLNLGRQIQFNQIAQTPLNFGSPFFDYDSLTGA